MFTHLLSPLQFFKSKTVWTAALMFVFNGLQAIHPVVDPTTASKINAGLAAVAAGARALNTQNQPK